MPATNANPLSAPLLLPLRMFEGLLLFATAIVLGCRVTSFIRSHSRNAAIGGHPQSYHLWGGAVDVGPETSPEKRAILRTLAREVDETNGDRNGVPWSSAAARGTGAHWHYQVDGRALPMLVAIGAALVALFAVHREHSKGGGQ